MDGADVVGVVLFFLLAVGIPTGLGVGWFLATRRVRELEGGPVGRLPRPDDRMAALERELDALRAEVEQVHNAQDFLNRVVADHQQRLPGRAPSERVVTPH